MRGEFDVIFRGKQLNVLVEFSNPVWVSGAFTHEFGTYDPGYDLEQVDFDKVLLFSERRQDYVKPTPSLEEILSELIWETYYDRIENIVVDSGGG